MSEPWEDGKIREETVSDMADVALSDKSGTAIQAFITALYPDLKELIEDKLHDGEMNDHIKALVHAGAMRCPWCGGDGVIEQQLPAGPRDEEPPRQQQFCDHCPAGNRMRDARAAGWRKALGA